MHEIRNCICGFRTETGQLPNQTLPKNFSVPWQPETTQKTFLVGKVVGVWYTILGRNQNNVTQTTNQTFNWYTHQYTPFYTLPKRARNFLGRDQCNSTVSFPFNLFSLCAVPSPAALGVIFSEASIRNRVESQISSSQEHKKGLAVILIIENDDLYDAILHVRKLSIPALILA